MRKTQRKYISGLVCVLLVACAPRATVYPLLGGSAVTLAELRGKVVLINYWAEWCRPCWAEIPELNAFALRQADRVRVLSVNYDGVSGEDLKDLVSTMGIEFDTLLVDPRQALGVAASGALPETIVINRDGAVVTVLLGPQTGEQLDALLQSLP